MGFRETFSRMIFYNLDKLERVGSVIKKARRRSLDGLSVLPQDSVPLDPRADD